MTEAKPTTTYRSQWFTQFTYTFDTAQRVGRANNGFHTHTRTSQIPNNVRDDLRALAGRKIKALRFNFGSRGLGTGSIPGYAARFNNSVNCFIFDANNNLIITTGQEANGISVMTNDCAIYYTYAMTIESSGATTAALNDTIIIGEYISLELEYFND